MGATHKLGEVARGAMTSAAPVLLSLAVTLAVWSHLRDLEDATVDQEFAQRAERVATRIEERLASHAQILRGAAGLFDADPQVTRRDFHDYVAHLELGRYQPGVQELAYAPVMGRGQLVAHVAAVRAEGFPDFASNPPGDRAEYALVTYAEPDSPANRKSLGFDLLAGGAERAAAVRARYDVAVSLTRRLVATGEGTLPGAMLVLPVHRRVGPGRTRVEERVATTGYALLTFRFADVLADIGGASNAPGIAFRAYQGGGADAPLVFDSDPALAEPPGLTATSDIDFGGSRLHLVFRERPDFAPSREWRRSTLIAAAGLVITTLIGLLFSRLATARSRAQQMAAHMTVDLRHALDRLSASEERIAAFIEFSPVAIVVAEGVEQRVLRLNRKFKDLFGYDEDDLKDVGDWWDRVIPDGQRRIQVARSWRETVRRAIEEGAAVTPQRRAVLCGDGVRRWIDIYTAAHGPVTITTLIDVSERKRIEEELTLHRDHLQALVEDRTRDLRHAKEAAERANQAKSDFLANMSHELRTPLHAILSFAHLGADRAGSLPPEKLRGYFGRVATAGDRLLLLIDDLLDLSKLEAGRVEFRPEAVDLGQLAGEAVAEFESLAAAKSLDVRVESQAGDPVVRCDRGRIGQVLRNLLGNAIKFTPAGRSIRIVLDQATLPDGDSGGALPALRLRVADEGIGIPQGELEAVFDKFVQSSKTRSGAGGTGLGLAICRDIVARHRGTIRAANNAAGGATFEVVLPREGH